MKTNMPARHRRTEIYRGNTHWLSAAAAAAFVTVPFAVVLWMVPVSTLVA